LTNSRKGLDNTELISLWIPNTCLKTLHKTQLQNHAIEFSYLVASTWEFCRVKSESIWIQEDSKGRSNSSGWEIAFKSCDADTIFSMWIRYFSPNASIFCVIRHFMSFMDKCNSLSEIIPCSHWILYAFQFQESLFFVLINLTPSVSKENSFYP